MEYKIYTTIEESNNLVALGIDPKSADMVYPSNPNKSNGVYDIPSFKVGFITEELKSDGIPCWSTEGLAKLLPNEVDKDYRTYKKNIISEKGGGYSVEYVCVEDGWCTRTNLVCTRIYDNLIDAFNEAVLILLRKGVALHQGFSSPESVVGSEPAACGKVKSYTTISESDELVRLGIDPNTADMYYPVENENLKVIPIATKWSELSDVVKVFTKPCWSLAAIFEQIKPIDGETYRAFGTLDGGACVSFDNVTSVMYQEEDLFTAAFNMLKWLLEKKVYSEKKPKSEITQELLMANGFRPTLNEDGDDVFKYEVRAGDGTVRVVLTDDGDGHWTLDALNYDKFNDRESRLVIESDFIGLDRLNDALCLLGIGKKIEKTAE